MKRCLTVLIFGILPLVLLGCQGKTELPSPTATSEVFHAEAYPAPQSEVDQTGAYPGPEGKQTLPTQITPNPPADAPGPEPGKASVSGTLYSPTSKMVIAGTQFYLTPGWGADHREVPPIFVGPQVDKGDISLISDSQGNFSVNNIPPDNYYLVVWAPLTWDVAQISETDTNLLLLELKADQQFPLGIVYVSWP
jgi:hypothetical protein